MHDTFFNEQQQDSGHIIDSNLNSLKIAIWCSSMLSNGKVHGKTICMLIIVCCQIGAKQVYMQ